MQTVKRQIKFLELAEVRKIIDKIPATGSRNLRDRALIETLFSTGLRISEALHLRVSDLKGTGCNNTQEITIIGKGGWQRVIFFSPAAQKAINKYLNERPQIDEKLFLIGVRGAQKMVMKRAQAAGIMKRVTPHIFRHAFATDLLRRGVDVRVVQEFLGHRTISSTMVYTHVTNGQLKNIHAKLYGKVSI